MRSIFVIFFVLLVRCGVPRYTGCVQNPSFTLEQQLTRDGFSIIAGADEAGRGAWAGPIVAAAVILDPRVSIRGIKDSKLLTPKRREALYTEITGSAQWAIGSVGVADIDAHGIGWANVRALESAIHALQPKPGFAIIDGTLRLSLRVPYRSVINGDMLSTSIAASSIIAKVTRDRILTKMHDEFPAYGFDRHRGYGTAAHVAALHRHGITPHHRTSFSPIRYLLSGSAMTNDSPM